MPGIKFYNSDVSDVMLGDVPVQALALGDTIVWQRPTPTPPPPVSLDWTVYGMGTNSPGQNLTQMSQGVCTTPEGQMPVISPQAVGVPSGDITLMPNAATALMPLARLLHKGTTAGDTPVTSTERMKFYNGDVLMEADVEIVVYRRNQENKSYIEINVPGEQPFSILIEITATAAELNLANQSMLEGTENPVGFIQDLQNVKFTI